MEVVELSQDDHVQWRCVEGPPEWVGTTVTVRPEKEGDGETVLLFTHADWQEPVEFMHHCSTKWATFLIGLRSGLEERRVHQLSRQRDEDQQQLGLMAGRAFRGPLLVGSKPADR